MATTCEHDARRARLVVRGELDAESSPAFRLEALEALRDGATDLVVDLRLVKFLNSTALGVLLELARLCRRFGGQLVIEQPSRAARMPIEALGLDRVLTIR